MQLVVNALMNQRTAAATERDTNLRAGADNHELQEAIKTGGQRPELAEAVGQAIYSNESFETIAENIVQRMSETGAGHGVLVSTVLRAAVNGTLKEIRSNSRFGCSGFAISACASLLSVLDQKMVPRIPKILLHVVMERMYEPAVVPAASDDTSPSTVDTPQPQTPFSPQTPDSAVAQIGTSNGKASNDVAADIQMRQDATLAFVGVLLARGQLLWEDVEHAVKAKLEHVVKDKPNLSKLLLKFVELLLTDKRKGAAGMMPVQDWTKLRILRQTQPTISDVYLMLKYLVQLTAFGDVGWKQPALACIQQVVHDEGFCRIAACDNPISFLKECSKPCMQILRLQPEIISPFRYCPVTSFFTLQPSQACIRLCFCLAGFCLRILTLKFREHLVTSPANICMTPPPRFLRVCAQAFRNSSIHVCKFSLLFFKIFRMVPISLMFVCSIPFACPARC